MRTKIILATLTLPLAMLDASMALAQDGSRIVMRRPLEAPAASTSPGVAPAPVTCGGPGNPCADECQYTRPQWVGSGSGASTCVGSEAPANASCMATDSSNASIAVPDSVCLENVSSYSARCGSFIGMPGSGPVAGSRPQTVPGTMECTATGQVVVTGIGAERVASGMRGSDGIWRIFGFDASSSASCTYPSAAPAGVECRVNGVPSDPSNCSVAAYSSLYSQNLVPVSPGGVTPSDIRFAQWVRPDVETSGCSASWKTEEGQVPPGCGTVTVPITVTCVADNPQSGDIPEGELSCDPATRPAESRQVEDTRACEASMSTTGGTGYSGSCGTVEQFRTAHCTRSDGTRLNHSDPLCTQVISDFCGSLPSGQSCVEYGEDYVRVREVADMGACPDPELTNFNWKPGGWSAPSATCGTATKTRTVECVNGYGTTVPDAECNGIPRPASTETTTETSGCTGPAYCSGTSAVRTFTDASSVDRTADCSSAGATCMETSFVHDGSTGSHLSTCYGNGSQRTTAPNMASAVTIRGKEYTFGSDGWCVYGQDPVRDCLRSATAVTPAAPPPPPPPPPSGSCTAADWPVSGDSCTGGTLIASGEYHRYSSGHPRGQGEESTGMLTPLECVKAGGNCWQRQRLPHTEYGEWSEENDYYECHAGATGVSPDGTRDGLPNNTDPEYFDAGFLQCTSSGSSETVLFSGRSYGVQGTSNCPPGPGDPESTYSMAVTTPPSGNVRGSYVDENRACYNAGGTRMEFTITQCKLVNDNYRQDYDEFGEWRCLRSN